MRKTLSVLVLASLVPAAFLVACEGDNGGAGGNTGAFDSGGFTPETGTAPDGGGSGDGSTDGDSGPTTFTTFHVAMGDRAACAVFPDGKMKCWGVALTTADQTPVGDAPGQMGAALGYVTLGKRVKKVTASNQGGTFCVLLEDGGVRCWGGANTGQTLGGEFVLDKITTNIDFGAGRTAVDVGIGTFGGCAVLDDGKVKCWGANSEGELGLGNTTPLAVPAAEAIDLGTGRTAKSISVGFAFSCATLDDDRVKCWGRGNNTVSDVGNGGNLCNGTTAHIGNDPGEMGDALVYAKLGTDPATGAPWKVKKLIASDAFACATLANDRLKCWGGGENSGVLGTGTTYKSLGTDLVDDDLPFVDVGTNAGDGKPLTVKDFAAGSFSVCALLSDDTVRCWGAGEDGVLGRGTTAGAGYAPGQMGDALVPVALKPGRKATAVYAGLLSVCARVDATTLSCWGRNNGGMLGVGAPYADATKGIGDDPSELGAGLVETVLQ